MRAPRPNALILVRWTFDAFLLLTAASIVTIAVRFVDWERLWETLTRSSFEPLPVVVTGALIIASWGVFWLRENHPRSYGWTEIGVGATAVMLAFIGTSSSFERAIKVISGVYLMVRGHDNRVNGHRRLEERRKSRPAPTAQPPVDRWRSGWWRATKI